MKTTLISKTCLKVQRGSITVIQILGYVKACCRSSYSQICQ